MRQLQALSDIEFEHLISDLLHARTGSTYERFGVGSDGGIDLRFVDPAVGVVEIVQCKHYTGSSFPQLLAAARKEVPKLEAMSPSPTGYRFITSQSMTPNRKDKLIEALDGWIEDPGRIWGAETIDDLLDRHDLVERRHVKLWLSSSVQLEQLLNAGTLNRSNELIERIVQGLPRYVQTSRFEDAEEVLTKNGVCLIAGEPGIGKTTLAQMLLLDCARQGYQALYISEDITEAWDVIGDRPQVIYYDDFLGRIGLAGLRKNEDRRLVDLIERARRDPQRTRLILTTREYILRGAVQLYETFDRADVNHTRFVLALENYTRYERGLVLYNHLYHSQVMKSEWLRQIVESGAYEQIVDHPNYNPRLIEFITGHVKPRELEHVDGDWVTFALAALDHPEEIWRRAFENELDGVQRAVLICLVSIGAEIEVNSLRRVVQAHCEAGGIAFDDPAFKRALDVLEMTFVRLSSNGVAPTVDVANPSVSDFVVNLLGEEPTLLRDLLDGASAFVQPLQVWEIAQTDTTAGRRLARTLEHDRRRLALALMRTSGSGPLGGGRSFNEEEECGLIAVTCGVEIAGDAELSGQYRELLWALTDKWEECRFVAQHCVSLYGDLLEHAPGFVDEIREWLKQLTMYGFRDASELQELLGLEDLDPELLGPAEMETVAAEFEVFAAKALLDEFKYMGIEDFEALEQLADRLEVQIDRARLAEGLKRARDQARLEERWDEYEGEGEDDEGWEEIDKDPDDDLEFSAGEEQEEHLSELFDRLAPDDADQGPV
jgi:Restriction endonuclease